MGVPDQIVEEFEKIDIEDFVEGFMQGYTGITSPNLEGIYGSYDEGDDYYDDEYYDDEDYYDEDYYDEDYYDDEDYYYDEEEEDFYY